MPESILDYIARLEDKLKTKKEDNELFFLLKRISLAYFLYGGKHKEHEAIDWAIHYLKEAGKVKTQYEELKQQIDTLESIKKAGLYEELRKTILESRGADKLGKLYKTVEEREENMLRDFLAKSETAQYTKEKEYKDEIRGDVSVFFDDFRGKADLWGLKDYLFGGQRFAYDLVRTIIIIKNQAQ